MSEKIDQLYLIKIDEQGQKSEVSTSEANFLIGESGSVNFGLESFFFTQTESDGYVASVIGGGAYNSSSGLFNVINGGYFNSNKAKNGGVIGGGGFNQTNTSHAVIGGGQFNCICTIATTNDETSFSFIGGGRRNIVNGQSGVTSTSNLNVIVGGERNCTQGARSSIIVGGSCNCIFGSPVLLPVSPGSPAVRSGLVDYNFIGNGFCNSISGNYSSILLGEKNCVRANNASILAGKCVSILSNHSGAVVLTDSQDRVHNSSGPNSLTLDFASGVYISGGLYLNGNQLLISVAGSVYSPTVTAG